MFKLPSPKELSQWIVDDDSLLQRDRAERLREAQEKLNKEAKAKEEADRIARSKKFEERLRIAEEDKKRAAMDAAPAIASLAEYFRNNPDKYQELNRQIKVIEAKEAQKKAEAEKKLLKKRNHGLAPLAPTKIRRQKPCVKCVVHQDGGSNRMNLVPFGGKGVKQKAPVESKEAKEKGAENPADVD